MKKKVISLLLSVTMVLVLLSGCSSNKDAKSSNETTSKDSNSSTSTDSGLTAEEQEALDAGLINLDGTLPIIKDPKAFEEKYGKISALIVNTADRTVPVGDLAMCKKWFEDTGT